MKKKVYLFLAITVMAMLFTGCNLTKEKDTTSEVNNSSREVKFIADGYSATRTSRASVSITDYLKEYTYFTIVSTETDDNTQYCILQSWDTISNAAITLEQNVDYEISNETQNLSTVYANVRAITDDNLARCTVTVKFHN